MYDNLVLTNNSGVHSKKAGEYGLMSVLMLQNYIPKIITNQKDKKFVSLFSKPIAGKTIVVVANLEPAVIRGVESNGMLLAASSDNSVVVVTVDDTKVDSGIRIS